MTDDDIYNRLSNQGFLKKERNIINKRNKIKKNKI
jgi:hypothetical protein